MHPSPSFFNRIAPSYGQQWTIEEESRVAAAAEVTRLAQDCAGSRAIILEVGCGSGCMLRNLPPGTFGLDYSMEMLREARRRVPTARLVLGSALRLPFRRGSVDILVAVNVIHNHDDVALWLREFRAASRALVVDFRNFASPVVQYKYRKYRNTLAINYRPHWPWAFRRLLAATDWRAVAMTSVPRPLTDPKDGFLLRHVAGRLLSLLPGMAPCYVCACE